MSTTTAQDSMTLLSAIESVFEKSKNSQLSTEFYTAASSELSYLSDRLEISTQTAAIAAIIFGSYGSRRLSLTDVSRHIDCAPLHGLNYKKDVEELVRKGWIRGVDAFSIPNDVLNCLAEDDVFHRVPEVNLNEDEFYNALADLCNDLDCGNIDYQEWEAALLDLIEDNQDLEIFRILTKYQMDLKPGMIVFYAANEFRSHPEDQKIRIDDIVKIYDHRSLRNITKRALKTGRHELLEKGVMDYACTNGYKDTTALSFSAEALELLHLEYKPDLSIMQKHLTMSDTIKPRELFYNASEGQEIQRLTDILMPENFGVIQAGLDMSSLRTGFNICLYGGPGTGKTETVLQLAKSTGRAVWKIDMAKMKSKWVGESESLTGWIFDLYRRMCDNITPQPILLINEADGLLGKRLDNPRDSVDQMSNTIQNILLDNIERQKGILIITTNLEQNLDSAFERRFLIKIKLNTPDCETRTKLWKSMLPDLSAEQAEILAAKYDFSGGQIENIARKSLVNKILNKSEDYFSEILEACSQENFKKKNSREKIGF